MIKIQEIERTEQMVLSKINRIQGTIEYIQEEMKSLDIPENYKEIHSLYTTLNENDEALKRAIFLQWYAVSEPAFLTGINGLIREDEVANVVRLNDQILNKGIDEEFKIMICHYFSISDWYFNSFPNADALKDFLATYEVKTIKVSTDNRGTMGQYWKSKMQGG